MSQPSRLKLALARVGQYVPVKVEHPTAPAAATELRQQVRAVLAAPVLDQCCCLVSRLGSGARIVGSAHCDLAVSCRCAWW